MCAHVLGLLYVSLFLELLGIGIAPIQIAKGAEDAKSLLMGGNATVPFPFNSWIEGLHPDYGFSAGALVVPRGSSTQAPYTSMKSPRTIVSLVRLKSKSGTLFDAWLGYAREAPEQVHAIVCRYDQKTCDFLIATDYREGAIADLSPVKDPQTCIQCHTSGAPLEVVASSYTSSDINSYLMATPNVDPIALWAMRMITPNDFGNPRPYFDGWLSEQLLRMSWNRLRNRICESNLECKKFEIMTLLFSNSFGDSVNTDFMAYAERQRPTIEPFLLTQWPKYAYSVMEPKIGSKIPIEPLDIDESEIRATSKRGYYSEEDIKKVLWTRFLDKKHLVLSDDIVRNIGQRLGFKEALKRLNRPQSLLLLNKDPFILDAALIQTVFKN